MAVRQMLWLRLGFGILHVDTVGHPRHPNPKMNLKIR
jgi:hypothetical protein